MIAPNVINTSATLNVENHGIEIMSGNVPDMILTDGLPVRQYAAKGLLEDLYPYIDADMGRDALITPVLDADSEDGKL